MTEAPWWYISISNDDSWLGAAFIQAEDQEQAVDQCRLRGYLRGAEGGNAELYVFSTGGEVPVKFLQGRLLTDLRELERYVGKLRHIETPTTDDGMESLN